MIISERMDGKLQQKEVGNFASDNKYDVIIVGLGTAGAIAAIVAARKGLKVLGIEKLNCMGGTATAGVVIGNYYGSKGGMFEEIDAAVWRMESEGYIPSHGVNADLKEYILEQEACKAGVIIHYLSTVTGIYLEDRKVKGVRWIGPDGVMEAESKIIIDCTGDAEVCALAGCETRMGRAMDGKLQPCSSVKKMMKNHTLRHGYNDNDYVDQTDAEDLTRAIIRSKSWHHSTVFNEDERLIAIAPMLGIREGRFIVGEDNITFEDYLEDRITDRPLFHAYSNIDNHGKDIAFESDIQQDWAVVSSLWGICISVPISLGIMIPKGYEGIMTAGRCVAIDHDIAAGLRQKRDMQKLGECAATAANLSIRDDISLKAINLEELQLLLKESKCLNEDYYFNMTDTPPNVDDLNKKVEWITDIAAVKEALGSEKPGIAIWSSKRLGEKILPHLKEWVENKDNGHLRKHSAFALALLHDRSALPVLREMAAGRDSFAPKTSRKYNQARGYTAVYLLGKLRDHESVGLLSEILSETYCEGVCDEKYKISGDSNTEFISTKEDLRFQYFTHAFMALLKIADHEKSLREEITDMVTGIVNKENFTQIVSLKGQDCIPFDMSNRIKDIVTGYLNGWRMKI